MRTTPDSEYYQSDRSSEVSDVPYRTCSITNEDEFIVIGNERHYRRDIEEQQRNHEAEIIRTPHFFYMVHESPKVEYGNAGALALISTSFNGLIAGFYLAGTMGITQLNVAVGLMFFYGGIVQFCCGAWELVKGHTFAATMFTSFGTFWIQLGATLTPAFGIRQAYGDDIEMFNNAMGLNILGWALFAFMMFTCTVKSNISLVLAIFTLDITLLLILAGFLTNSQQVFKAAGIVSVINAFIGWYEAFGAIANNKNSYHSLPTYPIPVIQGQSRMTGNGKCAEY